jgi:hypothetical protein
MPEFDQKSALISHVPLASYKLDHRLLVYFIALITQGGKYELRSSTLCNFLQPPATFSPVQKKNTCTILCFLSLKTSLCSERHVTEVCHAYLI